MNHRGASVLQFRKQRPSCAEAVIEWVGQAVTQQSVTDFIKGVSRTCLHIFL